MLRLSFFTLVLAALTILAPALGYAQKQTWLTEENIRAFSKDSEDAYKKPYEEYLAFIQKTTHDQYAATITTKIMQDGQASTEMPMTIDKITLLKSARDAYDSTKGATLTQDILSIEIAPDKKTARVTSKIYITNQRIAPGGSMSTILADTVSTSVDDIVYTPMVGIQVLKSEYENVMTIKQEQEL
ncbi:MAG TPA: hypothetical protein VGD95_03175 [Micavibrio sp.]